MALTTTVTKTSVVCRMPKMWAVTLTLVVTDDNGPGFTRSFSQNYKAGKSIPDLRLKFKAEMEAAIDQYKTERTYFDSSQLDSVVDAVSAVLET